jgi:hypothetical protein
MTLLWQTAVSLSEYFEQVIASDASKEQIENAQPRDKITHDYIEKDLHFENILFITHSCLYR